MARRAAAIKAERQANDYLLLLDAGNSLLGGWERDLESKARLTVQVMNRMGYDALTIGQGELRMGSELLLDVMAQADFPFLSANLTKGMGGPPLVRPSTVVELGSHRVAIIGATAPETVDIRQLEEGEVGALDPIESVRRQVGAVKGQAGVIIVLSYLGLEVDRELAQQVSGIDLIVGGNSDSVDKQRPLESPIWQEETGTAIVQARKKGESLGIIDLELDRRGRIVSHEGRSLMLGGDIADDAEFSAWFRAVQPTPTPLPDPEM